MGFTGFVTISDLANRFPLSWSHYVRLLSVKDDDARQFYEQEALRGGWTERQLDRQISSQFYERTLLSLNKAAMLRKGMLPKLGDHLTPEEEIKDPLVLEFLDLKDEYSEHDLEEALLRKLEDFLLELGGDFTFIRRQKRLRIGDEWYRVDLLSIAAYIDLNPVAAGIAKAPETSEQTSIKIRSEHVEAEGKTVQLEAATAGSVAGSLAAAGLEETLWLCPIEDRRRLDSCRERVLEGFSLGSYLLLVSGVAESWVVRVFPAVAIGRLVRAAHNVPGLIASRAHRSHRFHTRGP